MLKELVEHDGSDLYLAVGAYPAINKDGRLIGLKSAPYRLDPETTEHYARMIVPQSKWDEFEEELEANLAYMDQEIGRFRVNICWQRGSVSLVMRRVKMEIPTIKSLGLPPILRNIALEDRGIVIVTGATGHGKSTTMAAMLNYRNHLRTGHIVTIEDPIEFLYQHQRSIITQREVGIDTSSFEEALKNTLRQAPQVIVIGELRDSETVQFAIHASETGHLVFVTLHSTNATVTIDRILNFFPGEMAEQMLASLASNLRAVVAQRLIPKIDGGRVACVEIMNNTPTVTNMIQKGELSAIRRDVLDLENQEGNLSVDRSVYKLIKRGIVSVEEGLGAAESANDVQLKLRGIGLGNAWDDLSSGWENVEGDYDPPDAEAARRFTDERENEYPPPGAKKGPRTKPITPLRLQEREARPLTPPPPEPPPEPTPLPAPLTPLETTPFEMEDEPAETEKTQLLPNRSPLKREPIGPPGQLPRKAPPAAAGSPGGRPTPPKRPAIPPRPQPAKSGQWPSRKPNPLGPSASPGQTQNPTRSVRMPKIPPKNLDPDLDF